MTVTLLGGDAQAVLAALPAASVDAIITDPPYGLGAVTDLPGLLTAWMQDDDGQTYQTAGFMGHAWDVVPGPATWRAARRVLKPGGLLLACGGPRTWDLLSLSIRLAGWELRDSFSVGTYRWLHTQGFPKGRTVAPGWTTALKPAWEPILAFRAPLAGTSDATFARYGTGAFHIAATRIPTADALSRRNTVGPYTSARTWHTSTTPAQAAVEPGGRWPANVLLVHHPDCTPEQCVALCLVQRLGAQSGESTSGNHPRPKGRSVHTYGQYGYGHTTPGPGDHGTAARCFAQFWPTADDFLYCGKASRRERGVDNDHPTVKPLALMRWLVQLAAVPGGTILDPFCGSGTTIVAAVQCGLSAIGIDRDRRYLALTATRLQSQEESLDVQAPAPPGQSSRPPSPATGLH